MIEVEYRDRLGNNLFQYCFGRLLAEQLGFALTAPPIPGFPSTSTDLPGSRYDGPEVVVTDENLELDALLRDRSARKIIVRGYFQRAAFYRDYAAVIRQRWLKPATRRLEAMPTPDDIWVHVRRGDYMLWGSALPFSYYENAIMELGGGPVRIVTDDPADPFFWRFRKFNAVIVPGNEQDDFYRLTCASKLVLSQSSFSWWAAFLSEADAVVCPVPVAGIWAEQPHLRLDDARYRYLAVPEPYRPSIPEFAYIQLARARRRLRSLSV